MRGFTAEERAAATASLPALRASLKRPKREQIAFEVMKLLSHYWTPEMDGRLSEALAEDWINDLEEFSMPAIVDACTEWRRSENKFRPKPGELRALAAKRDGLYQDYLQRLEVLMKIQSTPLPAPVQRQPHGIQFKRRKDWTEQDWKDALMRGAKDIAGWQEAVQLNRPGAQFFLNQARQDYEDFKKECPKEYALV
jgi:hypothetical protein